MNIYVSKYGIGKFQAYLSNDSGVRIRLPNDEMAKIHKSTSKEKVIESCNEEALQFYNNSNVEVLTSL